jgi:hypothetical protein
MKKNSVVIQMNLWFYRKQLANNKANIIDEG